jgi:hypothetical protein
MFGLVLDVSLRRSDYGKMTGSLVRDELISFVNQLEDEDKFYLCTNPYKEYRQNDLAETIGRMVSLIGNWSPQEISNRLTEDLRSTLYAVTENGDLDGNWYFCLVTDRYIQGNDSLLSQILDLNKSVWGNAHVGIFTIGNHYHFKEYQEVAKTANARYKHLASAVGLREELKRWLEEIDNA